MPLLPPCSPNRAQAAGRCRRRLCDLADWILFKSMILCLSLVPNIPWLSDFTCLLGHFSECGPLTTAAESLRDLVQMQILVLHPRHFGAGPSGQLLTGPAGNSDALWYLSHVSRACFRQELSYVFPKPSHHLSSWLIFP